MTVGQPSLKSAGSKKLPATIAVWDPIVRLFHWSLVAAMAWELFAEAGTKAHTWVGYFILALLALRIVWGFVGTRHARFTDFVRSPTSVLMYMASVAANRPRQYIGHNPAGGWMVIVLMATIAATGISGWAMKTDALWGEEWIEELHEALANGMYLLIAIHVAGVVIASVQHRENLVRAMFTGRKPKH